ncbi:MAG: bifunctional DNA-formamidopyrimidine glycosylase/DNA-(apurinic or apyrimidinic site) lyase [Zetaproteobacteria bacterium]|nr:bifunctional DNA-formamidopyrimidine glycosylase/DNA-(apurinic or apyrimidinic site) lyase [Zetaproteobacteria bacterium]
MPELPEVEVVKQGLTPHLLGQSIRQIITSEKPLRFPIDRNHFNTTLQSKTIITIERRAKYLLIHFNDQHVLICHLGMTGQFHILPQTAPTLSHEHVRIDFHQGQSIRYRDPRRFGFMLLTTSAQLPQHPRLIHLGPEPFSAHFTPRYLEEISIKSHKAIKTLMMEQTVVVGIGNIYASESLFHSNISPLRKANTLLPDEIEKLIQAIQKILHDAIEAGGSSISDFVKADGQPGYFSHQFRVYGRENSPCYQCQSTIERITQLGRSTFFCPSCQQ